eukprot:TRINITY_DN1673_c0_g1_i1.p4 TRINITY_DN1673_c0_g1~~TRINITY_DN1673_c0_g1_i1.p4  ORF type:complete len:116 (+),score=38.43 TRINITY_DN1673_c0_g1_i1:29-376(+)
MWQHVVGIVLVAVAAAAAAAAPLPPFYTYSCGVADVLAPPQPPSPSHTLLQVQVVVRHGDRAPMYDPPCWAGYDEPWTCATLETLAYSPAVLLPVFNLAGRNVLPGKLRTTFRVV